MPAGADKPEADGPDALVDTSVAVPLVVADHEHHGATVRAVGSRRLGLAGHAAFETFSVLTRLPPPLRRTPRAVHELLRNNFPWPGFLSAEAGEELWSRLPGLLIAGGAVYDALVGAAAGERGVPLLTRDARALETYRVLGLEVELLGQD
jgi:predicted nucleic acid-binding protein